MTVTVRQLGPIVWSKALPGYTFRQLSPIIWYQDPPKGAIRQAPIHVLQQSPALGQVRQAVLHVLQPQRKNPTLIGAGAIYALINSESSVVWSASNSTLGSPSTDTSIANTNTAISITALQVSGYVGTYTLHYNRTSLAAQFASTAWLLGTISAATTIHALIPQINSAYGVYLDPTDIVDGPVAANATQLVLQVASTSYVYASGTGLALPSISLATATPVTTLPGFASAATPWPSSNTVALLHFDGANGSNSMVDSSGRNTFTPNGGIVLSTTQSKFGGSSLAVGGSNPSITAPDSPALRLGSAGDCTIEGWFFMTGTGTQALFSKTTNGSSPYSHVATDGTSWFVYLGTAAAVITVPIPGTKLNVWHHFALVFHGGVWTLYGDGVSLGTYTGGTMGNNAGPLMIGNWPSNAPFIGYIDEFRVSSVARYVANFTPATAPFTVD
ncbi:MAG: hypothetical protein P4L77_10730 [Sulfuriferula sp.]|nr:hypothetical protein [Sulfuriferula sp.]